jgi:hypothetical protein
MNGTRIQHILSLDPYAKKIFAGFSSPDLPLPVFSTRPALYVLNTGLSTSPGEHWCIACFTRDKVCYFFDPYGESPKKYILDPVLLSVSETLVYNTKCVQGNLAKTCGHHCIFFALQYARGYTPDEIMSLYKNNATRYNDNMVYEYIRHKYGNIIARIRE